MLFVSKRISVNDIYINLRALMKYRIMVDMIGSDAGFFLCTPVVCSNNILCLKKDVRTVRPNVRKT